MHCPNIEHENKNKNALMKENCEMYILQTVEKGTQHHT